MRVDDEKLAEAYHFYPREIRSILGIRSRHYHLLKQAKTLKALYKISSVEKLEEEDRRFFETRAKEVAHALFSEVMSLDALREKLSNENVYGMEPYLDGAFAARADEIVEDPVLRPQTLEEVRKELALSRRNRICEALQVLYDHYLAKLLEEKTFSLSELASFHDETENKELRSKILERMTSQISTLEEAVQAYKSFRHRAGTEAMQPLLVSYVETRFTKTRLGCKQGFLDDLKDVLPRGVFLEFAEKVFDSYLGKRNLGEANRIKEWAFGRDVRYDEPEFRIQHRWHEKWLEVYDLLHENKIKGALTLDQLLDVQKTTPQGSVTRKLIDQQIEDRLTEEVEACQTLPDTVPLWNRIKEIHAYKAHERLKVRRREFLEGLFAKAQTREGYDSFWSSLFYDEKEFWKERFVKNVARFFPKEDVPEDLIEVPA